MLLRSDCSWQEKMQYCLSKYPRLFFLNSCIYHVHSQLPHLHLHFHQRHPGRSHTKETSSDSFLFVTSLPYLRSYPTLHCTGNWTSGAALWLTEMWTTYPTIHCKSGCGTVTDRDVREGFKFSLPLSAIPTHSPTLWSINWIFENIANIRYFQKNRWFKRYKRNKYQSSAQGMEGPQSTKGSYRSQGP